MEPLRVLIDEMRSTPELKLALAGPEFDRVADGQRAEVIVFSNDYSEYLRASPLYRAYPEKCILVSGTDWPSFYLPAIYASNYGHPFSRGRTLTHDFFMAEANPYIRDFQVAPVEKKWLLSFLGGSTSWTRKRLLKLGSQLNAPDILIESTDGYQHWTNEETYLPTKRALQKRYAEVMAQSVFVLCPRGAGHSSLRLFEAMELGLVPIVVSDGWIPPQGPDWSSFALFLREREIGKSAALARDYANRAPAMGARAREEFDRWFAPAVRGGRVRDLMIQLRNSYRPEREARVHRAYFLKTSFEAVKGMGYRTGRSLILRAFKLLGRPFPYHLNRPGV